MDFEDLIKEAFEESIENRRIGDKPEEVEAVCNIIRSATRIVVPNKNHVKTEVINQVLGEFGISKAEHLQINTNSADLTRLPATSKALMAIDQCKCDLVIARGRLGVPGSGSLLVVVDGKGRMLTAAMSPPHVVHKKSLEQAVRDEMVQALERIGMARIK
jgi:hypothetical protein